jgi:nitrous oxidase accessory protein
MENNHLRQLHRNKMRLSVILAVIVLCTSGLHARILETGKGYQYKGFSEALSASMEGDTIMLNGGYYTGNFTINKSVIIIGRNNPIIDGKNQGTVITVEASGVVIEGITIQNSGDLLDKDNAGIRVKADSILIQNNTLKSVLFGIYFSQANGGIVRNNLIEGKKELDIPRRGDLFRAWYSNEMTIENNTLKYGRDFIIWFSHRTTIKGNNVTGARYGLHFMYSGECKILGNKVTYSSVGMYLMYSQNLVVAKNLLAYNRGASGFGLGLKDLNDVELKDNVLADNRVGIFIDNCPRNFDSNMKYDGNIIAYNEMGIEVLSTLQNNYFRKNSFIENYQHVSLTRGQNSDNDYWAGNYWSTYAGYDQNKDGFGDIVFREDQVFEDLVNDKPNLKILLYSPAVNTLNYSADAFPILKPQSVLVDKSPSISPLLPIGVPSTKTDRNFEFMNMSVVLVVFSGGLLLLFIFGNGIVRQNKIKSFQRSTND